MRKIVASVGLLLVVATNSAPAEEKGKIEPILAKVPAEITIGKEISYYCMPTGNTVQVQPETVLPVVGVENCSAGISTAYQVVYKGSIFYADPSDLSMDRNEIQRLLDMSAEDRKVYKRASILYTRRGWLEFVDEAAKVLENTKKQGIVILGSEIFDVSEYTEGTGFAVTIYNPTKKTIKYVTFEYVGYNAVKDPVRDYRSKSKTKTLKGVGPIEPGGFGKYTEEYAWMTDLVESHKITGIKIQYLDGTTKNVKDPKKAIVRRQYIEALEEYSSGIYKDEDGQEDAAKEGSPAAADSIDAPHLVAPVAE